MFPDFAFFDGSLAQFAALFLTRLLACVGRSWNG
jgi:hypothetical protein